MFQRGFKTWCENVSANIRTDLRLSNTDPLHPWQVAKSLGASILEPSQISGLSRRTLSVLLKDESSNWSAVTVGAAGRTAIIKNPTHSAGRTASDIMHELAHIVISHEPSRIILSPDGSLALRSYDQAQEDEANWLSGCLLLPRAALLNIAKSGMPKDEACSHYGVSGQLLTYRLNVTGVTYQMRSRRQKARSQ